jgi:NadR type nicotinamide-nucleotide adenylyltransferase
MSKAFVVMTALPPTKGHLQLLQFSERLADHTIALVCTQPDEPFAYERWEALNNALIGSRVTVRWYNEFIEQNPEAPGFWAKWYEILRANGFNAGDYIVASDAYGPKFAHEMGGKFMPYDLDRDIYPCKASEVRAFTHHDFDRILPEFQFNLRQTLTLIGAESTCKTTLSKHLARIMNGWWTFEWARPYLESNKVEEITYEAMNDIWVGQRALQDHSYANFFDKPFIVQDTDLFATVGYWDFWKGDTPEKLVQDATLRKSSLYIVPQSNIPFEADPIRYGGDERESQDDFWFELMEKHNLNYKVLTSKHLSDRLLEATEIMDAHWYERVTKPLKYERAFN